MTQTLVAMEPSQDETPDGAPFGVPADADLSPDDLAAIAGLVRKAREQGVAVTGTGSFGRCERVFLCRDGRVFLFGEASP